MNSPLLKTFINALLIFYLGQRQLQFPLNISVHLYLSSWPTESGIVTTANQPTSSFRFSETIKIIIVDIYNLQTGDLCVG